MKIEDIPWIDFVNSPTEPYNTTGGELTFNFHFVQPIKIKSFVKLVQNGKWVEGRDVDGPGDNIYAHIYGSTMLGFYAKTINIITDGDRYANASNQFFSSANIVVPRICNDTRIKLNLADREIIRELIVSVR